MPSGIKIKHPYTKVDKLSEFYIYKFKIQNFIYFFIVSYSFILLFCKKQRLYNDAYNITAKTFSFK